MKKTLIFIIFVLLVIIGFLLKRTNIFKAKTQTTTSENTSIEHKSDSSKPSKAKIFTNENKENIKEDGEFLVIDVNYPSFKDESVSKKIKDFVNAEIANFKTNNDPNKLSPEDKAFLFQNKAKWSFNIDYKTYESDKISSIVFNISDYTGGAHGGLIVKSLNFDNSGETISVGDLFKEGTNYLAKLSEISRKKLKASLGDQGMWIDDGTKAVTDNFRTFYLKSDGSLHIIFQAYSVAPWVNGTPEISIPSDEIKDIINPIYF